MSNFDPQTGVPINKSKAPAPINTRTVLYHRARPAIIVEGKGENDTEKRFDVAAQIKAKLEQGYSLTRFDGQHPHSFDDHRMEFQQRAAAGGDKDAAAALKAKAKIQPAAADAPTSAAELQKQIAELSAKVAALNSKG